MKTIAEIKEILKDINDENIKKNEKSYLSAAKTEWTAMNTRIVKDDHKAHDTLHYKKYILGYITEHADEFKNKYGFDFGCGGGRNIRHLLEIADFEAVDGSDINEHNIIGTISNFGKDFDLKKSNVFITEGHNLGDESNLRKEYHYIMSTITFEHIGNYNVRLNILKHMYNKLAKDGVLVIQLADEFSRGVKYYENSNIRSNVIVENIDYIVNDLVALGFTIIDKFIETKYDADKNKWYTVWAKK